MRYLLLAVASLTAFTPLFGKEPELSESTKATLGKLVAETLRPSLLLGHKADALKFTRGEVDQATGIKMLKDHAKSLSLSGSHCAVINDDSSNPTVKEFSYKLSELRKKQAEACESMPTPDAAADFSKFMLQSMFFKTFAKDNREADQLVLGSAMANSLNYLGSQAKVAGDAIHFVENEKLVMQALANLAARHPSLDRDPTFAKPINELLAEHAERGKKAAKVLAANTTDFYQSLIGHRSEPLRWNFEAGDKLISIVINSQKTFGTCVCSDCQLVVQGGISGKTRTLNFKVIHQAYKDGTTAVIDVF